jgi:hypothetical protein
LNTEKSNWSDRGRDCKAQADSLQECGCSHINHQIPAYGPLPAE